MDRRFRTAAALAVRIGIKSFSLFWIQAILKNLFKPQAMRTVNERTMRNGNFDAYHVAVSQTTRLPETTKSGYKINHPPGYYPIALFLLPAQAHLSANSATITIGLAAGASANNLHQTKD